MNADHDEAEAHKSMALEIILDAWEAGLEEGIEPEILASSAIFAALTDMIENHGEEFVAQMCQSLPARVRSGEFTLTHEPFKRRRLEQTLTVQVFSALC